MTEFSQLLVYLKNEIDSGHSQAYASAYNLLRQRAADGEDTSEHSALRLEALSTLGQACAGWTQSEATYRSCS